MTTTTSTIDADLVLKARHRRMWACGDYAAVADEVIPTLGAVLVQAAGVRRGQRVLDVAAGTGNASLPAALAGADVVATDLAPELLDIGRRQAQARGLDLTWQEADAEALPFDDASFDVVLSCVGIMFAPHHDRSAAELLRVCRPGGTVGLLNWTPSGFIGRMFAVLRPYVAAPPPGVQPPPLWGDEAHVRELLADGVPGLTFRRDTLTVDRFATAEEFVDFFKRVYGPTIVAYAGLADDPDRAAALDAELVALARQAAVPAPDGGITMEWEYLLATGTRV